MINIPIIWNFWKKRKEDETYIRFLKSNLTEARTECYKLMEERYKMTGRQTQPFKNELDSMEESIRYLRRELAVYEESNKNESTNI